MEAKERPDRNRSLAAVLTIAVGLWGCASPAPTLAPASAQPFDFGRDTFAFVNELEWNYRLDPETGAMSYAGSNQGADYTRRCFVVARSARQFYQFARFDPQLPRLDADGYRRLVRRVIDRDPSETAEAERVSIPGYAGLRDFSRDWEPLLRKELGGWPQSYFQRGNWRMVFPFSRRHQQASASALALEIAVQRPPIVHVSDFPTLNINHAVLLYGVTETPDEIRFDVYDPNENAGPSTLTFVRDTGRFHFGRNGYFGGGVVDVYEIYRSFFY